MNQLIDREIGRLSAQTLLYASIETERTMEQKITSRQREAQQTKLANAKKLLNTAIIECETATPDEISQTVDIVLEIVSGVNEFLKTRPRI